MTFNEYQELAKSTAIYPESSWLVYPALGLAGETGEVAEKVKKLIRDGGRLVTPDFTDSIKKELGDVLWYISALASDLGLTLDEIAEANYQKLKDRMERNIIHGSGDNR